MRAASSDTGARYRTRLTGPLALDPLHFHEVQMGRWQSRLGLTEGFLRRRRHPSVSSCGRSTSPFAAFAENGEDLSLANLLDKTNHIGYTPRRQTN